VIIRGDPANKLAYVIQGPTATESAPYEATTIGVVGSGSSVQLIGVTIQPTDTAANAIHCDYAASLYLADVAFTGPVINGALISSFGGQVQLGNTIDVYSSCHAMFGLFNGAVQVGLWYTNIVLHGVTWGGAFIIETDAYAMFAYGWCNFTGSSYGPRYWLYLNSVLYTQGPANFLPGSAPGAADASSAVG
jgi:hypothetical protein